MISTERTGESKWQRTVIEKAGRIGVDQAHDSSPDDHGQKGGRVPPNTENKRS